MGSIPCSREDAGRDQPKAWAAVAKFTILEMAVSRSSMPRPQSGAAISLWASMCSSSLGTPNPAAV